MRIVGLQEFLKLPCETLFSKYQPCIFGDLCIKKDSITDIDFFYVQLSEAIDADGSCQLFDFLEEAEKNVKKLDIDLHCWSRDGMFEKGQLFAVWELEELNALAACIGDCIKVLAPPQACT